MASKYQTVNSKTIAEFKNMHIDHILSLRDKANMGGRVFYQYRVPTGRNQLKPNTIPNRTRLWLDNSSTIRVPFYAIIPGKQGRFCPGCIGGNQLGPPTGFQSAIADLPPGRRQLPFCLHLIGDGQRFNHNPI